MTVWRALQRTKAPADLIADIEHHAVMMTAVGLLGDAEALRAEAWRWQVGETSRGQLLDVYFEALLAWDKALDGLGGE
jgi:hypothetical protein